jgi:hypothetical protein
MLERIELMGATSLVVRNKDIFIALRFEAPSKPNSNNIKQIQMKSEILISFLFLSPPDGGSTLFSISHSVHVLA